MAPTGQAERMQYEPGKPRPQEPIPDEGECEVKIHSLGKPGDKGWSVKPGKFPCRAIKLAVLGSDDGSGKELTTPFYASASPRAFNFIWDFMASAQYPEAVDLPRPAKPNSPEVHDVCEAIDAFLTWAFENEVVMPASISHEKFNGRDNARVTFLPPNPEEEGNTETDENAEPEANEPEAEEEQVYPKTGKKAGAKVTPAPKKGGKR